MNDPFAGAPRAVLHAGQFLFADPPMVIETLLGSCIAITMWHPQTRQGAMCHFALPGVSPEYLQQGRLNARYANDCLLLFQKALVHHGLNRHAMVVKVFGGGDMSRVFELASDCLHQRNPVGNKNIQAAFEQLELHQLAVDVTDVGDFGYRKLKFVLETGDVWVKFVGEKGQVSKGL